MTSTTVRVPSVADTVRTYVIRSFVGDEAGRLRGVIWLPIVVLLVLAIPRLHSSDQWPTVLIFFVLLGVANAVEAARREHLFGGPRRLVVAAGLTTFLAALACLLTLIAVSITLGPEPGSSAIEALGAVIPANVVIGGLLLLMVAAAAAYWIDEPARTREDAEKRARIRAEREARGKAVRA